MKTITRFLTVSLLLANLASLGAFANEIEYLWPKGKMPDQQPQQIAAMIDVAHSKGFKADKNRLPYLDWYDAPAKDKRTGACMILISGGAYNSLADVGYVKQWHERLTAEGVQCVNLVYRTPRSEGIPYYKAAWEDGQRAVKLVRSEAKKRGYDPNKIGIISMSAGSHMGLLLATSSLTRAYVPVDKLDTTSCNINWAVLNAPAYVTTDASKYGTQATRQGYGTDVKLDTIFHFDSRTCPISIHQGGRDPYSPNGATLIYRQLRRMKIPAELHLYPDVGHRALGLDRAVEFMRQMGYLGKLEMGKSTMERYAQDFNVNYKKENVWPDGKMPDRQANQCEPYLEWYFPKEQRTKAIQIIYSGGSYNNNKPDGDEVAPVRRYLNEKGMTVVTMKYRVPRPPMESGLDKHTTAWEDLQRAIRMVRSEASQYGLDPQRIGIMGSSAGGHLTLLGVTSSMHQTYLPIDDIDKQPCNVQWGIAIYPAYVLSDGVSGGNKDGGNLDRDVINPEFSFDLKTAPMLFIHGDADGYASMGSVKVWEKLRAMGIQSELHTLALRKHCLQRDAYIGTGSYTYMDRIWEFLTEKKFNK